MSSESPPPAPQRWPTQLDYQDALQNPALSFVDADLQGAEPTQRLPFGLPQPISGQFANVYHVRLPDGREQAIRLFLTPHEGRDRHYAALTEHLRLLGPDAPEALVPFSYEPAGLRVRGIPRPLVRMDWVPGDTLSVFVERHLYAAARLTRLAQQWIAVMAQLGRARMAHGDLQHGNILVESAGTEDRLRLIDYDGMWAPSLAGRVAPETGHPAYQHRERATSAFGPNLDRFPALVVYVSLMALAAEPTVWYRLNDGDNLLLQADDLLRPETGRSWEVLKAVFVRNTTVWRLLLTLKAAATGPYEAVPALDLLL